MATVIFYEKPGCINNTRQKQLLETAGHTVLAKDLLTEAWDAAKLLPFFKGYLVSEWFNRAAPRVKSGEVQPECVTAREALELMRADPLLIRRPLMQVGHECQIGFDPDRVQAWIGLWPPLPTHKDLETCPRSHHSHAVCPGPM